MPKLTLKTLQNTTRLVFIMIDLCFFGNSEGGVKTISAPHMIVTLLHNLELEEGQHIVIYGAKGGYLSALIAHIIGENGRITVLDPSIDVIEHISNNLRGYPTVNCRKFLIWTKCHYRN